MPIDTQAALNDLDAVLAMPKAPGPAAVGERAVLMKACVERWAPAGSSYRRMSGDVDHFAALKPGLNLTADDRLRAITMALRRDYEAGVVCTFEEIVHASVFENLLEQASQFVEAAYLLPAAVIAGASLEDHLRELARKNSVPIDVVDSKGKKKPKMASALNRDLCTANVYSQPQWRQIDVWIDIRNEAAHGKAEFRAHSADVIERMIEGVRDVIVRHPA